MAALREAGCHAESNGANHAVGWECAGGRAIYTNTSMGTEYISPLGIALRRGQTLAVEWRPGRSDYTLEVYGRVNAKFTAA
jgi:hypothetical protein